MSRGPLWGAILLVAGTTIGAGMLALPIATGCAGFFPSILLMGAVAVYMLLNALYLLETTLSLKQESNLITMVRTHLGRGGEVIAWLFYLLLLYALLAAYIMGSSQMVTDASRGAIPAALSSLIVFLFFGGFVYFGTALVDGLNRVLMGGLALSYLIMIGVGLPHVHLCFLMHKDLLRLAPGLSVIMTSFGYHIIIPTLTTYLKRDRRLLVRALVIGSLIPFVVYVLWQFLALGVIPIEGQESLLSALGQGNPATFYLSRMIGSPLIATSARFFALFAIVTSLLGVALSLSDFLADGLRVKKTQRGRLALLALTFLPPLGVALFYPRGFVVALHYAGICVVLLLALLPALMALRRKWRGEGEVLVPGGWPLAALVTLVALVLLGMELG